MSARRVLARSGLAALAAAVLAAAAVVAPGSVAPASAATTKQIDYDQLAQQVAQEINRIRQNPTVVADELAALDTPQGINLRLADGTSIWSDDTYRQAVVRESRVQPVLPALAWSDKLASAARAGISWANAGQPHAQLDQRLKAAGVTGQAIEAIYGGSGTAQSQAWAWWVSGSDGWNVSSPFVSDYDAAGLVPVNGQRAVSWRGHRGIVNDNRMTAIGVACGPNTDAGAGADSARCVAIDSTGESDAVAPVAAAGGTPQLSELPGSGVTGTVGAAEDPNRSTITVDTAGGAPTAAPTSTQTSTAAAASDGPETDPSLAGGGLVTVNAAGETVGTAQPATGELAVGQTWDVFGDGTLKITVRAEDLFTPTAAAYTQEYGTPATQYRGYQVTYENGTDTPLHLPDVAKSWACLTTSDVQMPFVLQPPGQGLPSDESIGRGTAVFAFGCGVDPSGVGRVGIDGGSATQYGRQWWDPAS